MSKEKRTYNPCDDCKHSCSRNNQESGMCKICELNYFIERVLDYREQTKWISVDERLPDETCECLTADALGLVMQVPYSSRYRAFNATDEDCCDRWKFNNITHWMPLPEPPKMKGGAE